MKRSVALIPLLVGLLVSAVTVFAQTGGVFTLDWFSVDGGGGASTGSTYTLVSSIGQPDAGNASGGQFTLAGGFLSAGLAAPSTPTRTTTPGPTPTATGVACTAKPAAPLLVAPKNNASTTKTRVTLKWQAAHCADTYRVKVINAVTKQKVDSKKNLTVLKYKTVALSRGATYQWFVKACNSFGCVRSAKRTFSIQ